MNNLIIKVNEIIDDVIDKKIFMTDKEKEYYLNEVHENYISFLSDCLYGP